MRFDVTHRTRYLYGCPVFLEPQTVRLRPRVDYRQRLIQFSMQVEPSPAGLCESIDLEGNCVAYAWFGEQTDQLTVTTSFVAETDEINPFGFLLRAEATGLPLAPAADEQRQYEVYAQPRAPAAEVAELARRIACEVNFRTAAFVSRVNEWIHENHEQIVRPVGCAWEPTQTLLEKRGSCRDLAVLLIEACRVMNIPSRFVSGYGGAAEDEDADRQLHAWAEVYLPGAGWRGFDPSLGLAITERHLAVATGATPLLAAPTSGSFRGDATSRLEAEIEIETSASAEPVACQR